MLIPLREQIQRHGVHPRAVAHIGGHLGEECDSYEDARVGRVWWIEANPALIRQLGANVHPSHDVIHAAVAGPEREGQTVALNLADNGQSSSILEPGTHLTRHPEVHFNGTVDVTLTTLDRLAVEHLIAADYLNLDCQGVELDVIRGGAELVLPFIRWINSEVNLEEVYRGCALLSEMDHWLHSRGFIRIATEITRHGWGDALWRRI